MRAWPVSDGCLAIDSSNRRLAIGKVASKAARARPERAKFSIIRQLQEGAAFLTSRFDSLMKIRQLLDRLLQQRLRLRRM